MSVIVHVQATTGVDLAQLQKTWGADIGPVGNPSKRLYVVAVDVFGQAAAVGPELSPHKAAIVAALKQTLKASECAETAPWDFALSSAGEVVEAAVRKQGIVLYTSDGVAGIAPLPEQLSSKTFEQTIAAAYATLIAAREAAKR